MRNLLIIFIFIQSLAQLASAQNTKVVSGTVVDNTNYPLVGVNVKVSSTNNGTITDLNGKFVVTVPIKNQILEFSYIGFETKSVDVSKDFTFKVVMTETNLQLDEIVAVGYASQTKVNLTGSVQSVSVNDAEMRSITSADALLQGKAAGLQLTQNSAQPGEDEMEMRVRGVSSVDNNSSPLVIIDGVEGELNSVNPRDIESISVLKDASSAAIYGNKAAAGVIIIKTKEGKKGIKVNYNTNFSVHVPTRLPNPINDPVTYIDLSNEAHLYSDVKTEFTDAVRQEWVDGVNVNRKPVNWKNLYFMPGYLQTHYINLSGAGSAYDFSFSTGFADQKGVIYSARGDKFDYRLKLNLLFFDEKLKIGAIIGGKDNNSHEALAMSSILNRYLANDPTLFIKTVSPENTLWGSGASPIAIEELGGGNDKNMTDLSTTYNAIFKPLKGLTLNASYNMTKAKNKIRNYTPMYELASNIEAVNGSTNRSQLTERIDWNKTTTFNAYSSYECKWKRGQVNVLAGYEVKEYAGAYNQIKVMDLKANQPVMALGDPNTLSISSISNELASMSYFGRVTFDFNKRYLFEANIRRDGSSRFAKGNRYATFPSVSAAWRISQENFMQPISWINNLKLRTSVGRLGNERLADYYVFSNILGVQEYYSFGGIQVDGTGTTKLADKNTTWETVDQINIGVDFDFLNDFSLVVDVFEKNVTNMLAKTYLPISLGIGTNTPYQNAGSMRNRGLEATFSYRKKLQNDLHIGIDVSAAYIVNKVIDLGGPNDMWHDISGTLRSEVGQSFMSLYGYDCIGIYQENDFTWQNNSDLSIPHLQRTYQLKPGITTTELHHTVKPGDLLMRDIDGDNMITPLDKIRLGKGTSDFTFSSNISVNYKEFSLSILAQGQGFAMAYLSNPALGTGAFSGQIFEKFLTERWTPETPQYRAIYADKERMEIVSSYDMFNKAYLRIKNIQFGYTFKPSLLKKVFISGLKVYATAENLFTFTSFPKDFDPERDATNNTVSAYPLIKTVSIGASLSF